MTSTNFGFLEKEFPILFNIATSAEFNLFAVADRIKASYHTAKKINHLPQVYLSKAFRGVGRWVGRD
jgi:hypothetical protein